MAAPRPSPPPDQAQPGRIEFVPASPAGRSQRLVTTALERVAILVASLALSIGLIALMSGFFAGRDPAAVGGSSGAPLGQVYRDLGNLHLRPSQPRPVYDSDPPTSGAHLPVPVTRDATVLSDDQLLQALSLGDIVVDYGTPRPPPGLAAVARSVSGSFTPALAAAGQAVIMARRPGTSGLIGLAWTRMVHVSAPSDPLLRAFAEQWLGRGA